MGFADTLRAALRLDPDVLLIGEIRDEETANIAVKAALTGHLVLSTLHNSDAVTAIQRLLNLGIAPFISRNTDSNRFPKISAPPLFTPEWKQVKSSSSGQKLLEEQEYGLLRLHSSLRNSEGEFSSTGPDSGW